VPSTREVAILYAIDDIPVFPCNPDKTPAVDEGFKGASIDPQQVSEWFQSDSYLIGVPTAGYLVVDLDRHHDDADGVEEWHKVVKEHDSSGSWRDTMMVRTPSGGVHIWFIDPNWPDNPHRNTASKLGPGIDTRADGGYVIIPPSVTVEGQYVRFDEADGCRLAPDWLVKILAPKPRDLNKPVKAISVGSGSGTGSYAEAALRGELKTLSQAPKGTRNHALNRASFVMGTLVASGLLDEARVINDLEATAYDMGLEEKETELTIRSGIGAGMQKPRKVDNE